MRDDETLGSVHGGCDGTVSENEKAAYLRL